MTQNMPRDSRVSKALKNSVLIWNPCTGECFNANDTFCSLNKVWAAIGTFNVRFQYSESFMQA